MSHNLFVFDTNVLVSAALSPHSVSADALKKALLTGRVTYYKYSYSFPFRFFEYQFQLLTSHYL
jgi:predicted nucleic acid-binding protein